MQFRVLGPLEVVPVDDLVDAVWGDDPPASAPQSLHSHVSRLRGELADLAADRQRVITRGGGYVLHLDDADEVDAAAFQREARQAQELVDRDPARALELIERAEARWRPGTSFTADGDFASLRNAAGEECHRAVVGPGLRQAGFSPHRVWVGGRAYHRP